MCVYVHTRTHAALFSSNWEMLKRYNETSPSPRGAQDQTSSPSGRPDKMQCLCSNKTRGRGESAFLSRLFSFCVSLFFSPFLSFLPSLCLCPLPEALKRDENHSTKRGGRGRGVLLIHWPCFAGKAGFEQGPWHKGDEFSDRSLILNGAQCAVWV